MTSNALGSALAQRMASALAPSTADPLAPATNARKASFARKATLSQLERMRKGRLRVELPEGAAIEFGDGSSPAMPPGIPPSATLRVANEGFFTKCLLAGDIGFAESYMDGDWSTPDLTALIAWFLLNHEFAPTLSGSARARAGALNALRWVNRLRHVLRGNSKSTARRNIGEHYDLSNAFFALFLDPSMMYSAALWRQPGLSLEQAQFAKNEALCRKLRLRPGVHVLEIGSGWGGWALHAASLHGCRVTSVTLSSQQYACATRRVAEAGLSHLITIELRDYRDLQGSFDRIVSIEMLEAVGHRYLPTFCSVLNRILKPGGIVALQFITCPDARYEQFRKGVDFIQKHIFPGSLLLSANRVSDHLSRAGGFQLHDLEDFGPDYARTLNLWHARFAARLPEVRALGFDERFIRKWTYYLKYCEAAFAMRNISVVQTVHTRPNNLSL